MENAKRDSYGVPGLLGQSQETIVPIRATPRGNLYISESKALIRTIRLELHELRNNLQIVSEKFTEITFNIVDSPVIINFINPEKTDKELSIVRPTNLCTSGDSLWLSNQVGSGILEIWIWE